MSNQMAESIGAMEGAFFISRTEILDWLNQLLKVLLVYIYLHIYTDIYILNIYIAGIEQDRGNLHWGSCLSGDRCHMEWYSAFN